MSFTAQDERFMQRALAIAARAEGRAEPNPMVGCVLVRRGRIIGEGYHRRCGALHAERDALKHCTSDPRGATAYVTLEPCCHTGRQPPCTEALLEAGIARVVCARPDVDPRVAQRGFRILRRAGVKVTHGLLKEQADALMAPYLKRMQTGIPWVILKWAQSIDGAIATHTGDSRWITDPAARRHVHRVRARVDAILIGAATARHDDPSLTARDVPLRRTATRVVLDSQARLALDSKLVGSVSEAPLLVLCSKSAPAARRRRLEQAGCETQVVASGRSGLQPRAVLRALGRREMTNVVVEGGGDVLGSFHDAGLADEVHIYLGNRLLGGVNATRALGGRGVKRVIDGLQLPPEANFRRLGGSWLLAGRLVR